MIDIAITRTSREQPHHEVMSDAHAASLEIAWHKKQGRSAY